MPKSHSTTGSQTIPTAWSDIADWYDQLVGEKGSEYHQHVVLPGVIKLLMPQPGQRVLDVACGQGVLTRLLASQGVRATGLDASKPLIASARNYMHKLPTDQQKLLEYHIVDASKDFSSFFSPGIFDSGACVLAIQNIHPIQPLCNSVSVCLKPQGVFVMVMMHPHFRAPKQTSWGWDENSQTQYRRVDRYLIPRKVPIITHPGKKDSTYTWSFHKPLETYVKSLRNAGLLIDTIEEWTSHKTSQPGPRQSAENLARKEIPLFMAIRSIKIFPPKVA